MLNRILLFAVVLELIINYFTAVYVDIIGILIVLLLLQNYYQWQYICFLSFIGDVLGQWLFGSHLFAAVLIGIVIKKYIHVYYMSHFIAKYLISLVFAVLFFGIMYLVSIVFDINSINHVSITNVLLLGLFQILYSKYEYFVIEK